MKGEVCSYNFQGFFLNNALCWISVGKKNKKPHFSIENSHIFQLENKATTKSKKQNLPIFYNLTPDKSAFRQF